MHARQSETLRIADDAAVSINEDSCRWRGGMPMVRDATRSTAVQSFSDFLASIDKSMRLQSHVGCDYGACPTSGLRWFGQQTPTLGRSRPSIHTGRHIEHSIAVGESLNSCRKGVLLVRMISVS